MATSIERKLLLPGGPQTGLSSPVPAASERPRPRARGSANAEAACKSRRSRAEAGMPRHRDWQNGRAGEARRDNTPGILPPHNRDTDECRAPLPRHQTVLEWSAPLWLNVPTEIFVPASDSHSASSSCRTPTMAFGRRTGLGHRRIIGSHRSLRFEPHAPRQCIPAARAACAAARGASRIRWQGNRNLR